MFVFYVPFLLILVGERQVDLPLLQQFVVHRYLEQHPSEHQQHPHELHQADVVSEVQNADPDRDALPHCAYQRVNVLSEQSYDLENEEGTQSIEQGHDCNVQEEMVVMQNEVDGVSELQRDHAQNQHDKAQCPIVHIVKARMRGVVLSLYLRLKLGTNPLQ